MIDSEGRPRRFFISYRRRANEDARLANLLVDELRKAGHEVFIDVDIPVGRHRLVCRDHAAHAAIAALFLDRHVVNPRTIAVA